MLHTSICVFVYRGFRLTTANKKGRAADLNADPIADERPQRAASAGESSRADEAALKEDRIKNPAADSADETKGMANEV